VEKRCRLQSISGQTAINVFATDASKDIFVPCPSLSCPAISVDPRGVDTLSRRRQETLLELAPSSTAYFSRAPADVHCQHSNKQTDRRTVKPTHSVDTVKSTVCGTRARAFAERIALYVSDSSPWCGRPAMGPVLIFLCRSDEAPHFK